MGYYRSCFYHNYYNICRRHLETLQDFVVCGESAWVSLIDGGEGCSMPAAALAISIHGLVYRHIVALEYNKSRTQNTVVRSYEAFNQLIAWLLWNSKKEGGKKLKLSQLDYNT